MIIWKGRGLLTALSAGAGAAALAGVATASHATPRWENAMLALGACAGTWVAALTFCKPKETALVDPASGQPVVLRETHDLYFVSAKTWAVLASFVAAALVVAAVGNLNNDDDSPAPHPESLPGSRGKTIFESANASIDLGHHPEAGGNTPEAEALAQRFSTTLQGLAEKAAQSSGSSRAPKGTYQAYCHLGGDYITFLVHVPELRKYDSKSKDAIAEMAWMSAAAASSRAAGHPKHVALGIRGVALYDRAIVGTATSSNEEVSTSVSSTLKENDAAKVQLIQLLDAAEVSASKKTRDAPGEKRNTTKAS